MIANDIEDQRERRAKQLPISQRRVDFLLGVSTDPKIARRCVGAQDTPPGLDQAIDAFLQANDSFVADRKLERCSDTYSLRGCLRRIKPWRAAEEPLRSPCTRLFADLCVAKDQVQHCAYLPQPIRSSGSHGFWPRSCIDLRQLAFLRIQCGQLLNGEC